MEGEAKCEVKNNKFPHTGRSGPSKCNRWDLQSPNSSYSSLKNAKKKYVVSSLSTSTFNKQHRQSPLFSHSGMASLDNTSEAAATGVDELSNVLRDVHAENLAAYSRLLENEFSTRTSITSGSNEPVTTVDKEPPFWDIVVITAGDKQQKHCYQQRIDQKLAERSIPIRAR